MTDDINNKGLQKMIFIISLVIIILAIVSVITSGLTGLFEFRDTFMWPFTTRQAPYFITVIVAIIALFFTGRNLRRMRRQNEK